jgi:hypothetical protein
MRPTLMVAALALMLAPSTFARTEHSYDKGTLLSMESVSCGYQQNSGKSVASEIIGTDAGHTKTQELLCQEYTIRTDRLIYHVRPRDAKHPALLPVGETVDLRIQKDKMYLRAPEGDDKEREYQVISIQMREDARASRANP